MLQVTSTEHTCATRIPEGWTFYEVVCCGPIGDNAKDSAKAIKKDMEVRR